MSEKVGPRDVSRPVDMLMVRSQPLIQLEPLSIELYPNIFQSQTSHVGIPSHGNQDHF